MFTKIHHLHYFINNLEKQETEWDICVYIEIPYWLVIKYVKHNNTSDYVMCQYVIAISKRSVKFILCNKLMMWRFVMMYSHCHKKVQQKPTPSLLEFPASLTTSLQPEWPSPVCTTNWKLLRGSLNLLMYKLSLDVSQFWERWYPR